jgi:hypothetical protein
MTRIVLVFLLFAFAFTQAQPVYFSKSYHKEPNMFDAGLGTVEYNNAYYTIGQSSSNATSRYLFLKADLNGDTLLTKYISYVNRRNYVGTNLTLTTDNNLVFCGTEDLDTLNGSLDSCVGVFIKIDLNGDTLWTKRIRHLTNKLNLLYRAKQTTDKGFIICGVSATVINYAWALKLDSLGNIQWQYTYGGNGNNEFYDLEQTFDGGYVFSGNSGGQDLYVVKTNGMGIIQWQKNLGTPNQDGRISYVHQLFDSNYIVTGYVDTSAVFNLQAKGYMAKLRKNGSLMWQKMYTGTDASDLVGFASKALEVSNSEYLIKGSIDVVNHPNVENCWLVKTDSAGNFIWERTYNYYPGKDHETVCYGIMQTPDKGFLLTGSVGSSGAPGGQELWLAKIDSLGCDTIDCSLGIRESLGFIEGFKVYPNPTNNNFTVETENEIGEAALTIYDMYGRQCHFTSVELNTNTLSVSTSGYPDGIYFVQLKQENGQVSNRKLVISN